ncbi:MAG: transcription elongation factor GreAB [Planctomycetes bacterium RBG_13_46_10]|nr:MAG: transcription elongation factor GreAB [Planctomycetes bacterium RBG_13_46_10]
MKNNNIYITNYDLGRLNELIRSLEADKYSDSLSIEQLKREIKRAKIVHPKDISGDIVTMNSRVRLKDMDTYEEMVFKIVFPPDADIDQGRISVLAPVGTALLGYKVGDTISWNVPGGIRRLNIQEVLYQPEAEGDLYQ